MVNWDQVIATRDFKPIKYEGHGSSCVIIAHLSGIIVAGSQRAISIQKFNNHSTIL